MLLIGLAVIPTFAGARDLNQGGSLVRVLSVQPGAATALTPKSEIEELITKSSGSQRFVCTRISLAKQRESVYRVVLSRAELVCD